MLDETEAAVACDLTLSMLDSCIAKLLDATTPRADEVVVVHAIFKFEQRLLGLEAAALEKTSAFQLRQDAIDSGQADMLCLQTPVDVLGGEMHIWLRLEQGQHLKARLRGLKAMLTQVPCISVHQACR